MGGTELLQRRLYDGLVPRDLLEQFQIIFSRVREIDESKYRILYCHDLPGDPESNHLANGGWKRFHKIVFVSNWQMQAYINVYDIPWSHCEVIENSIYPIELEMNGGNFIFNRDPGKINLVYTSTPHRGLDIALDAFKLLKERHKNITFDVFSSFKLYGWEDQRDGQFKELYEQLQNEPGVTWHGTVGNDEIRKHLAEKGDVLFYPSTWPETSCLCLIEALSAGLVAIHSNYGALPETSGGMSFMYQFDERKLEHTHRIANVADAIITNYNSEYITTRKNFAKIYADNRFNWNVKAGQWAALMNSIISESPSKADSSKLFTIKI